MTADQLKRRTKAFGVAVIKFARTLRGDDVTIIIVRQLIKSATSVGANYRSSCRAKSRRDFISKMTTAEEEADETQYWLEVLVESDAVAAHAVSALLEEADQLVRILVASIKTARRRAAGQRRKPEAKSFFYDPSTHRRLDSQSTNQK